MPWRLDKGMKNFQNSNSRTSSIAAPYVAAFVLALAFCAMSAGASAASKPGPVTQVAAAMDFGAPPSGEIPILYNDHTVYSKPDILKQQRVLAALVKGGVIYMPLRSMF